MACLSGSQTGADGYFGGAVRVIVGDASLGFWDLMVGQGPGGAAGAADAGATAAAELVYFWGFWGFWGCIRNP